MARVTLEGKVPMPVGGWEPSRQLGHEGEVRNDIPSTWVPSSVPTQAGGPRTEQSPVVADAPLTPDHPSLAAVLDSVDRSRIAPRIQAPVVDGVQFESRSYRLGGHTGTLSPTEQQEVLQVVARSIIRSLQEEAQRVRDKYEMQQHPSSGLPLQAGSNRGTQDVRTVPEEVSLEIETLEGP